MEKRLTREELLESLISQAQDPFCSIDKFQDIRNILFRSDTFQGINHLYLAALYLDGDALLFDMDAKKAYDQIALAIKEGNRTAYFLLYRLARKEGDFQKARNALRIAYDSDYPKAYVAMGRELREGGLFPKDDDLAEACFKKAVETKEEAAYVELYALYLERGEKEKADALFQKAKEDGHPLPGVVS